MIFDDACVLENALYLGDAPFDKCLLVFGFIEFAAFGHLAEFLRLMYLRGDFGPSLVLELPEFFL